MKKIFLMLVLSVVFVLALCVNSFAFEIPEEYEGTNYGAHYDTSHDGGCCTITNGETSENHYDEGYKAGYGDGLESSAITDEEKQAIISDYLASSAYAESIAQAKAEAVEDYKGSEQFNEDVQNSDAYQSAVSQAYNNGKQDGENEYKGSDANRYALQAQYQSGVDNGYQAGYDAGYGDASETLYDKGVADGMANFRTSNEYKNTLQANYDGGYEAGYIEASSGQENVKDDSSSSLGYILGLAGGLVGLFVLYMVLSKISKKKGRK